MASSLSNTWRAFLSSRWFLVGGVAVLLLLLTALSRAWYRDYHIRAEIERLQAETSRLEAKRLETLEFLKYVRSPAFVEEQGRRDLNLATAGESVAIISRPTSTADRPVGQPAGAPEHSGWRNFRSWWRYFIPEK